MSFPLTNKLKLLRTEAGLTQAELSELVGVSRKTINTIENSIFIPLTVLALKLSVALNVPVEDVFMLTSATKQ